ncbi:MAG: PglZ domain-containing protein [Bacteroidales bacterium]|nr:PglZ domain-containing protein [Bacteroidales bacterium]
MSELLNKITNYFQRNAELRVLFIFQDAVDLFTLQELNGMKWPQGFRYVEFKGDWFTTKYRLDTEWAADKVVLFFHQDSPLKVKSLQASFPLMDVLVANAEYHSQDYTAFMQEHRLPMQDVNFVRFVEKNVVALQSDKMMRLLAPYYQDGSMSLDMMVRGFLCNFMGIGQMQDWDNLIVNILLLGLESKKEKRLDFFLRLRESKDVTEALQRHLQNIFGISYDDNTEDKVGRLVQVLKYNAIVQNLVLVEADNYRSFRIKDGMALQHLNRILSLALSNERTAADLTQLFGELGAAVRDADIVRWYGTEADYYFVPEALCVPIVTKLMEQKIENEPDVVASQITNLRTKHKADSALGKVMDFAAVVAHFYQRSAALGTIKLNRPDDYAKRYITDYYLLDQLYRNATEIYYSAVQAIHTDGRMHSVMQTVRATLDMKYSKLCNLINLEWTRCLREAGGLQSVDMLRQQDFYDEKIKPLQKKTVVIVSDALRYEVAQELATELTKGKNRVGLEPALAMMPTETKYCKPALLPHRVLKLYGMVDTQNLSVDDKQPLSSIESRSEHLRSYRDDALAVTFEKVAEYNTEYNRELFKHSLVYIFHDAIDSASHTGSPEEITTACRKAIEELKRLVERVHSSYNVTEVYVTSDHGFLFNNINFEEKDKQKIAEDNLERSSRYYLTNSSTEPMGVAKFNLSEVSGMVNGNNIWVAVPEGTNRFAAPSGGYMFTHGGAALQELIIPVVVSKQERTEEKQPVNYVILESKLSIQMSRLHMTLFQSETVGSATKERTLMVGLFHNGVQVSPLKSVLLNSMDIDLNNRRNVVELTLNKNVEAKVLQLKIFDANDTLNPLETRDVVNNTLIENDFDF